MTEILQQAIRHYGRQHQQTKAVEELGELQQAILKCLDGRCNLNNLTEEIADVEIVLEQIKMMFPINEETLKTIKARKILRLKSRMDSEVGLQK